MNERYVGQNFVECIGSIIILFLILTGLVLFFLWEPDPVPGAINTTPINVTVNRTVDTLDVAKEIASRVVYSPAENIPQDYSEWKYLNKQFNLSEWYTFSREDVQGLKDLTVKTTVYRVRTLPNYYTWEPNWGGPTDGSADWANTPAPGNQYAFIWICEYMEGADPSEDPSMWGMDADHFYIQARGQIYKNIMNNTDLTTPPREFENIWDLSNTVRTGPYGVYRTQDHPSGKVHVWPLSWMRMGRSNAWDGWVIFEIPRDIRTDEINVLARFEHLGGNAFWSVKPGAGFL